MKLLELAGVARAYGAVRAVDGVDLAVSERELVALIGPNGAGKSTCFGIASGQIAPDRGSVRLAGEDVTRRSVVERWRRGMGRTFQVAQVFPSFSVVENVQLALASGRRRGGRPAWHLLARATRLGRERAFALLEEVRLAGQAEHRTGLLSYGDRKRLELALALAHDPRILLMDEPTAGLGPADRRVLLDLVAARAEERGCGVLFTEHDLKSVFDYATRVVVLVRGRVLAAGAPGAVREDADVRAAYLGQGGSL